MDETLALDMQLSNGIVGLVLKSVHNQAYVFN